MLPIKRINKSFFYRTSFIRVLYTGYCVKSHQSHREMMKRLMISSRCFFLKVQFNCSITWMVHRKGRGAQSKYYFHSCRRVPRVPRSHESHTRHSPTRDIGFLSNYKNLQLFLLLKSTTVVLQIIKICKYLYKLLFIKITWILSISGYLFSINIIL